MEYIKARGIWYRSELNTIRKKKDVFLQPLFEALTNAWEAIGEKYGQEHLSDGDISIDIFLRETRGLLEDKFYDLSEIVIRDNGIGLTDKSYERLINLRDNTKHFLNKGTGRVQYIHFFDETVMDSLYDINGVLKRRKVTLSKNDFFLANNAIMRLDLEEDGVDGVSGTIVTFKSPLDEKDAALFAAIDSQALKKEFIRHFLVLLSDNRDVLPKIEIHRYVADELLDCADITKYDIPEPDKTDNVSVHYSTLDERNKIKQLDKSEDFTLRAFVHSEYDLEKNVIYLVSKGQLATSIAIDTLQEKEVVDGKRYMFFLSGSYIDTNDSDDRGELRLISSKEFKKQETSLFFSEEIILLDDIKEATNAKIKDLYQEIEEKNVETQRNIETLQEMFLLDPKLIETFRSKIKNTDTDEQILTKIYQSDAQVKAEQDAKIKRQFEEIEALLPTDADYQEKLDAKVKNLVIALPLQNRMVLAQYIARRRIVLELFDKILTKELTNLKGGGRIDEDILHNLIFQQSSTSPEKSELWLINEEFIYFKGVSEKRFQDIEYNGIRIFDKQLSQEDEQYLNSIGEKRLNKRPDVLLFPEEGKAIIIEFKAPDVNVAEHLNQIDFYASILLNYTRDDLKLRRFYGYLIGESIQDRDVRGRVSRYESAPKFGYWFRPSERVVNFNNENDSGNIYTEILSYSSLLQRAKIRNKMFIDKLESREE